MESFIEEKKKKKPLTVLSTNTRNGAQNPWHFSRGDLTSSIDISHHLSQNTEERQPVHSTHFWGIFLEARRTLDLSEHLSSLSAVCKTETWGGEMIHPRSQGSSTTIPDPQHQCVHYLSCLKGHSEIGKSRIWGVVNNVLLMFPLAVPFNQGLVAERPGPWNELWVKHLTE